MNHNQSIWLKQARLLGWFTVIYNMIEAIFAIGFGWNDSSVSLAGFGLDSLVEVSSAVVVLWQIRKQEQSQARADDSKALKLIGALLVALAIITVMGASYQLYEKNHPASTVSGMIISLISLSFMWFLYRAKVNVGQKLNDRVILADAECAKSCMWLSVILFLGSTLFWFQPQLWWVDSVAALGLAYFIAREGIETIQHSDGSDHKHCC